jgi:hypothetical protein
VAGVTPEDGRLIRLYPVPYRALRPDQRFDRFDVIEAKVWKAEGDPRPESYKLEPESVRIVQRGDRLKPDQKLAIWQPQAAATLDALREANRAERVSLGIVLPEPDSIRFLVRKSDKDSEEDRELTQSLMFQQNLFGQASLKPLKAPEYSFFYRFRSGNAQSEMKIHDWEVQATYLSYTRRYGKDALDVMRQEYEVNMPANNLHFIMGTMMRHPAQFIIIGLLRSSVSPEALTGSLF